ncbi:RagB/SusD family nutrient uptake outer membrane protein [Polaribacter sp.]|uniref:RagB/SusD family nutrient uptake outer membrane protein n=1 Tax=Polaribacter sp. TaxID=1920175 RepID=UPI003EF9530A
MKQRILKICILILTLGVAYSCVSDDYFEIKNPNEIARDQFWRNLSETQLGLNAVYQTLHKPGVINKIGEMLRSDMGYPGYGRPIPQNTEEFYLHTYNGSTEEIVLKWETNYQGIFRANQVIEALEGIQATTEAEDLEKWTSQMAQARFFRGLFHYYLYTSFNEGSIIIRDFVPKEAADYGQPLSSATDVIKFIREDLEYAYKNLYKKGEYPDGDISKVTAGAAGTILGTTYLQELDYATAMPYFNDVIKNQGYELEDDLTKMFTSANGEFNSESIFEINFSNDNIQFDLSQWDGSSGTNWLNQQTSNTRGAVGPAWIALAYKSEPMDAKDPRNFYEDVNNNNQKTRRNVPLRASAMIAIVEDNQTTYYLEGTTSDYGRFQGKTWGFAWWKKFQNHDIVSNESELPGGAVFSSKNVTLNRLSEVYLMQAECMIKTGDIDGALKLINDIRQRWGLVLLGRPNGDISHTYDRDQTDPEYTADELMQRLMKVEKPLELGAEGHSIRFLDFQRWKKSDNYGFKERLEELSNEEYYAPISYSYVNALGETKTKNNYPTLEYSQPSGNYIVVDYEYDIPYLNYSEEKNGYYPIPFNEVNANPYIN